MNRNDIIRMAREADAEITNYINYVFDDNVVLFGVDQLERFAARVAAAEREACAQIAFNAKTYIEAAAAIRARGER